MWCRTIVFTREHAKTVRKFALSNDTLVVLTKVQQHNMSDSVFDAIKNLIPGNNVSRYQRLLCQIDPNLEKERKRSMRQDFAKSKSRDHVWGPTHSQDSDEKDDSSVGPQTPVAASPNTNSIDKSKSEENLPTSGILNGIWNCASETINDYMQGGACTKGDSSIDEDQGQRNKKKSSKKSVSREQGSPYSKTTNESSLTSGVVEKSSHSKNECDDKNARAAAHAMAVDNENLWEPPPPPTTPSPSMKNNAQVKRVVVNSEKRDRHREPPPFKSISFKPDSKFSRSISELTMRSSFGETSEKLSDSRLMAYYAVGNHKHKKNGSSGGAGAGGNRRCYFSGEIIRGGQPFYAGSVQQGLRTLVVFCLPKALGLPRRKDLDRVSAMEETRSMRSTKSTISLKSRQSMFSRYSSVWSDGAAIQSQFTEWEEDENGNLCETMNAELLLQALPEPDRMVMDEMELRYPDQFATLPQQVRQYKCWRCYMKFCFFSGLPIADGEMYYKVVDKISARLKKQLYKAGIDEIILSHEVMEAVHGQSAEIVNLPTKKTFQYLQKHYTQQCAKLSNGVFKRTSWEKVMPEV